MISLFVVMAAASASASAHASAGVPHGVDVVFLPEVADAPSVVITLENHGASRSLAFALLGTGGTGGTGGGTGSGMGTPSHGTLVDDDGVGRRGLGIASLPLAPRGAGLIERDGALSFTIDDAGAWETTWAHVVPSKTAGGALPVPGPKGLRLVVHGTVDGGPASAVLYGNKLKIAGTAVVTTTSTGTQARGVVTSIAPMKPPLFLAASGTAVDRVAACNREAPSAISVVPSGAGAAMKLYAKGAIACAGPLAIVPVEGLKLDAKKDVPVRGIVIAREVAREVAR